MNSILVELKTQDLFHLVFFNGLVNVLDVEKVGSYAEYPSSQPAYNISPRESNENLSVSSLKMRHFFLKSHVFSSNSSVHSGYNLHRCAHCQLQQRKISNDNSERDFSRRWHEHLRRTQGRSAPGGLGALEEDVRAQHPTDDTLPHRRRPHDRRNQPREHHRARTYVSTIPKSDFDFVAVFRYRK